MARPLRIEYEGAYYHVISRGNAGEHIFKGVRDHRKFLEYLEKAVDRFSIIIHSYCLMPNHYHLLIETPYPNLSRSIQWLNVSYASYFNKKRKRSGHLFQGRFKSILVDADEYLTHLSRYIHRNPVKANIALNPGAFPWSSYPAFIGNAPVPDWLETKFLLSLFGREERERIINYRQFVEDNNDEVFHNVTTAMSAGCILGGEKFVKWVTDTFLPGDGNIQEIPQLKKVKSAVPIEVIIQRVCVEYQCCPRNILEKGHKDNMARDISIYLARDYCGMTCCDLGNQFGGVSGAAITARYKKIASTVENNDSIKRKVDNIKMRISDAQAHNVSR